MLIPKRRGWFRVAALSSGSVFGELSFFDGMPRSARMVGTSDSTVLKISKHSYRHLMLRETSLALALANDLRNILSLRLRQMNRLVQVLID